MTVRFIMSYVVEDNVNVLNVHVPAKEVHGNQDGQPTQQDTTDHHGFQIL